MKWRAKIKGAKSMDDTDFKIGIKTAMQNDIVDRIMTLIKTCECATKKCNGNVIKMMLIGNMVLVQTEKDKIIIELIKRFENFDQAHAYFWELVKQHDMEVEVK